MSGIVINSKEESIERTPFVYGVTEEGEGCYIDFKNTFKTCAENVFFSEVKTKKILNLEIQKKVNDCKISNSEELDIIVNLYLGKYEGKSRSRRELIDLMLDYWWVSQNFKDRSANVMEDIENENIIDKYKILPNLPNNLTVSNLREFFRFSLYEHYKPIENTVLTKAYKTVDRIYNTEEPLKYYTRDTCIANIKVMFGNNLFEPDIIRIEKRGGRLVAGSI